MLTMLPTHSHSISLEPDAPVERYHSITDVLKDTLISSQVARASFETPDALQDFYMQRGFQSYWLNHNGPSKKAEHLLEKIEGAWTHGLNPNTYHLQNIQKLWDSQEYGSLADLDLLLSDAYIRYGRDISGIRVDPRPLKTNKKYWRQPLSGENLFKALDDNTNIKNLLEDLEPRSQTYHRIRDELITLVNTPAQAYEAVLPIKLNGILRPYERHKIVPALRTRLGVRQNVADPFMYDDYLTAAIIEFQRKNGLKDDALVGRQTLNVINISRKQKIHQIIANLERLRWVEESKPEKFVVVNIPSATLWAVDEGRVAFEMPVIVGRKKRPTHSFVTEIRGVRFNPNWTVPPTIKKKDILPKLQENPEYLNEKGMELTGLTEQGYVTLDPAIIDWANVTNEDLHALRFVQDAGANNPLGRVRVLMPNRYNIYLHDTNEQHYFEKPGRAISSGCVRLKEPEKFAEYIMQSRSTWEDGDMQTLFDKGKTRDISIDSPIPVYLLYYTTWLDQNNELIYGHDLYGHDSKLIKMLNNLDEIFIPINNTVINTANLNH